MCEENFIKFDGRICKVTSQKGLIKDFKFVMREYVTFNGEYDYLCNLDEMSFFQHPVIQQEYTLINGAAACYKGKTIVMLGSPYTGKTSVLCEMINRGAELISDDILLLNRNTLTVLPVHKPICFRRKTINMYGITKEKLKKRKIEYRLFKDEYGERFLIHPFDILNGMYVEKSSKINELYIKSQKNSSKNYYNLFFAHIKNISKKDILTVIRVCEECEKIKICDLAEVLNDI